MHSVDLGLDCCDIVRYGTVHNTYYTQSLSVCYQKSFKQVTSRFRDIISDIQNNRNSPILASVYLLEVKTLICRYLGNV